MPRLRRAINLDLPSPGEPDHRFRECIVCLEVFAASTTCPRQHPERLSQIFQTPLVPPGLAPPVVYFVPKNAANPTPGSSEPFIEERPTFREEMKKERERRRQQRRNREVWKDPNLPLWSGSKNADIFYIEGVGRRANMPMRVWTVGLCASQHAGT